MCLIINGTHTAHKRNFITESVSSLVKWIPVHIFATDLVISFLFFFFFESDCSSLVLLFVLLLFCQCTHHFFLGVSADVADVSLCYCVAQILEAKSSCAKDYDVCAVTDVVLLFSKCQVFGYNHPRHRVHEERFLENGKGDETCW